MKGAAWGTSDNHGYGLGPHGHDRDATPHPHVRPDCAEPISRRQFPPHPHLSPERLYPVSQLTPRQAACAPRVESLGDAHCPGGGGEGGLEYVCTWQVTPARVEWICRREREEATPLGVEDGGANWVGVEGGVWPPVDAAINCRKRDASTVTNDGIVGQSGKSTVARTHGHDNPAGGGIGD